eukprot:3344449-Pyramimonas_sp.AAC.1
MSGLAVSKSWRRMGEDHHLLQAWWALDAIEGRLNVRLGEVQLLGWVGTKAAPASRTGQADGVRLAKLLIDQAGVQNLS